MKSIIEGLLFLAGEEGLSAKQLAEIVGYDAPLVRDLIYDMRQDLINNNRGIRIAEVAGNFRLTTNPEHAPYFEKLAYSPGRSSLSQAALETLSIVAYRQPITRIDIEEIRGVKSERPLHTLVAKDLIEEVGRADAIGRPILYGTTKAFLDYFGLASLKALPEPGALELNDLLDEQTDSLFDRLDKRDDRQLILDEIPAFGSEIAVAFEDEKE
nr:SMC-Scp complex subunit ScpB [Paenibacillus roseus]